LLFRPAAKWRPLNFLSFSPFLPYPPSVFDGCRALSFLQSCAHRLAPDRIQALCSWYSQASQAPFLLYFFTTPLPQGVSVSRTVPQSLPVNRTVRCLPDEVDFSLSLFFFLSRGLVNAFNWLRNEASCRPAPSFSVLILPFFSFVYSQFDAATGHNPPHFAAFQFPSPSPVPRLLSSENFLISYNAHWLLPSFGFF